MAKNRILIIDFGGQYDQLIARRVRECCVFSELYNHDNIDIEKIRGIDPKGIIFTGGPQSAYGENAPTVDEEIFRLGIPILGICYGAQLMAYRLGGEINSAPTSEYGRTEVTIDDREGLLRTADDVNVCWMSHTDYISRPPEGFAVTAHTEDCPVAGMEDRQRRFYAVQFHPEVEHTAHGFEFLRTFVLDICGCSKDWKMESFAETQIKALREKIGTGKVLLALSGGVDSSVVAALLAKAIGPQLTCVFVDHGLLRKDEAAEVAAVFGDGGLFDLDFVKVDATDRFYQRLTGAVAPEDKRKIIGEEFIRVFEEEAKKIGRVEYLAQGTIYPDVIESGLGKSAVIKSHHNVGGLPDYVDFREIIEPLRLLFKDEVRQLGRELGLPEEIVSRQPFPGPGLGVRIIGEVTAEKCRIVQDADAIYREEIAKAVAEGRMKEPNQYFAALTNMQTVGVMGDFRTYDYAIALRAVTTSDFMTAEAAEIPWDVLQRAMTRIVNEVDHVNRVFYDLTSKPPGTVEME
ncbi:MAG: glutamine-hydrolyzing GMP synthase [Erysipelotrichaceae bacterium]|nr:glutamine-hydrolyzing GMP synthase [Erysipelotrichaceae bacterium]